jgi:hypothetical protein
MDGERYIPVNESPGLFRDSQSGAIINMDRSGAQKARDARNEHLRKETEMQELKSEVKEIKGILQQLLERL